MLARKVVLARIGRFRGIFSDSEFVGALQEFAGPLRDLRLKSRGSQMQGLHARPVGREDQCHNAQAKHAPRSHHVAHQGGRTVISRATPFSFQTRSLLDP